MLLAFCKAERVTLCSKVQYCTHADARSWAGTRRSRSERQGVFGIGTTERNSVLIKNCQDITLSEYQICLIVQYDFCAPVLSEQNMVPLV